LIDFNCYYVVKTITAPINFKGEEGGAMKPKDAMYEAPKVITYSEDEIIELLGPAQTCSPSPCPTYK
jgi:hypothetical protein